MRIIFRFLAPLLPLAHGAAAFSPPSGMFHRPTADHRHRVYLSVRPCRPLTLLAAITEDRVIELVEEAERLWTDALDSRKEANALSSAAQDGAEAARSAASEADAAIKSGVAITVEKLRTADAAAHQNIDAGGILERAVAASEEADRLEALADQALKESEKALEKHLEEFPDSPLA